MRKRGKPSRKARWKGEDKKISRGEERKYICTEGGTSGGGVERKLASRIGNRRQPERMRLVIIRAPVKSSPFIPGSFASRILPHLSPSLRRARRLSTLSGFFTTREIFPPCVTEHLGAFRGYGREANGCAYSSDIDVARCAKLGESGKNGERPSYSVQATRQPPSLSLSAEASTHNEFIKHREAAGPCGVKRRGEGWLMGGQRTTAEYLFIAIASRRRG